MKIYNEVTSRFNDKTGKWETISEDSFNYDGPVAQLMADPVGTALPANAHAIHDEEKITETLKVTSGYFTNGDGTLEGEKTYTGSLSDSNEKYYFNVTQTHPLTSSAETQFSVTFGHMKGSGSDAYGDTSSPSGLKSETQAIYKQFSNLLLDPTEASGGFKIAKTGGTTVALGASTLDEAIYVLVGKRNRFKDRINKKAWTLQFRGRETTGSSWTELKLTDDSAIKNSVSTPAGDRYNIVSGAAGNVVGNGIKDQKCYGWFYPDMGMMIFSAAELSGSIPGPKGFVSSSFDNSSTTIGALTSSGFAYNDTATTNPQNALSFVQCMTNVEGTNFRLRAEEDQTQINYFCRIKPADANFSNNPTFVSGSKNKVRNTDMIGNPTTFISGVGLYNAMGQLVAVARLSSPLKKNFSSEATIKVKLTY